jgi:hypothetical protein
METGDWIAIYGAVVATCVAAWQAATYWAETRPKIRVGTFLMTLMIEAKPPADADPKAWIRTLPWRLQIEVLNLGRSSATIGSIEVRTKQSESGSTSWSSLDWDLPWTLAPGEERMIELTDLEAGLLEDGQELLVEVRTTTGRSFTDTVTVGGEGLHLVVTPRKGFVELAQQTDSRFYTAERHIFGAGSANDPLVRFLDRGLKSDEDPPSP